MAQKMVQMEKDNICYLYVTWHASIFDTFAVPDSAGSVNFGKFDGVANPPEDFLFYFIFRILIVYNCMEVFEIQIIKNILIIKRNKFTLL